MIDRRQLDPEEVASPAELAARHPTRPELPAARLSSAPAIVDLPASDPGRRDTPILPATPHVSVRSRATLTLLNGLQAGRLVSLGAAGAIIGCSGDVDLVVDEAGVSRRHARVGETSDGDFYIEDLGSTNGTFIGGERVSLSILRWGDVVQLGPQFAMRFAVVDETEELLQKRLYDSSVYDPLTRLFNRKYVCDRLVAEVARSRRTHAELSLLMVDVDSLKQVNDRFGHLAGDRALCTVGERMKQAIRVEDVLARYGGDEFLILAPGTGEGQSRRLAERVRHTIAELQMSARGENAQLTLSVGGATLREVVSTSDPVAALLALADSRLYYAKSAGRNRVCTTGPTSTADDPF